MCVAAPACAFPFLVTVQEGVMSHAVMCEIMQGFLVSPLSPAAPKCRSELCAPQHHRTLPPCLECFSWPITAAPVLAIVRQVDGTVELADPILKQVNQNKFDNDFSRKNVLCDSLRDWCRELGSMTLWFFSISFLPCEVRFNIFRRHLLKYSYK